MTETRPPSPLSLEGEPSWLNPATIKGAIAVALGVFFLLFPAASLPLIRFGLGGALIFLGASDLWAYFSRRDGVQAAHSLISSVLAIVAGLSLVAWPSQTVRVLEIVLGTYLALQGFNILLRALRSRAEGGYGWPLTRGLIYIGFGTAMFFFGEFLLQSFLLAFATLAIAAGLISIAVGITVQPVEAAELNTAGIIALSFAWLNARDLGPEKRTEVADTLFFEQPDRTHKITSYTVMLLLSVVIATLAILQDSTAVVIGAMLIAPLMMPIMGTAAAIVNGWRGRMTSSLIVVAISVAGAIATAWFVATWVPALVPLDSNSQVLSRVTPTLLDLLIALAAGAAGAYATVDDRVSASLPGVAIAVALVPPLGVVGVPLTAGNLDDAFGAFLLFSTNFVSIILASVVVFIATGFSPVRKFLDSREQTVRVLGTLIVGGLLIMIPLGITGSAILNSAQGQSRAHDAAVEWLEDFPNLDLGPLEVDGASVRVNISGPDPIPAIADLQVLLDEAFGEPVTVQIEHFATVRINSP